MGARARSGLSSLFSSSATKEKELRRVNSESSGALDSLMGEADEEEETEVETAAQALGRMPYHDPPNFDDQGSLLDKDEQALLWQWIPARHRVKRATLVYSGTRHGYNLHTLYRLSDQVRENLQNRKGAETSSLMLIKTEKKEIIGSYTSTAWRHFDRYFGNGECNVFRLRPRPHCYRWSPSKDTLMMLGTSRSLSVGAEGGPAIWLDDELQQGYTSECETFASPPLTTQEVVETVFCRAGSPPPRPPLL